MTPYEELRKQIAEIEKRHGGNRAELLRKATSDPEIEKSKFYKFLRGETVPSGDTLLEWITRLGFTLTPPDEKMEGFSLINMVEAEAGAGESHLTSGKKIGEYAFRTSFLQEEGLHPDKCTLMRVAGDSMEPLIRNGDVILVDESDRGRAIRDGQIYVVGLDDALMVKRIAKIPSGWRLCSENRDRGDVDVLGDDLNSFRVYGGVRWFGRVV